MFYTINQRKNEEILTSQAEMIGDAHALLSITVEMLDQLTVLNMKYATGVMNHGADHAKNVIDADHPQHAFTLHAQQWQPNYEKVVAYTNEMFHITNQASAKITALINDQFESMGSKLERNAVAAAEKSPIAAEVAVAVVKQAAQVSKQVFEKGSAAAKNAVEFNQVEAGKPIKAAVKAPRRKPAAK